jgi:hypothetical protein
MPLRLAAVRASDEEAVIVLALGGLSGAVLGLLAVPLEANASRSAGPSSSAQDPMVAGMDLGTSPGTTDRVHQAVGRALEPSCSCGR